MNEIIPAGGVLTAAGNDVTATALAWLRLRPDPMIAAPCKRHHWSQVINLRTGEPTGDVGCWNCGKRREHRHRWQTLDEGQGDTTCVTCHRVRDAR